MDPNMVLGSSPGLTDTIVPRDSKSYPDMYGPSGSMASGPKFSPGRRQSTGISEALNSNKSCRYKHRPWLLQNQKPTLALWQELDLEITMVSDGKLTSYICPLLSDYISSFMCLSMGYEPLHFFISPISSLHIF